MCKLGVTSEEQLKIEIKLLLSANGKLYMPRRLTQQQMTLGDLEWPFHASRAISAVAELLILVYGAICYPYCDFQCNCVSFYRASICEGGLGSRNSVCLSVCLSVRQSVCPSVTRVDCDKTKLCTADILIPHERAITLLL